MISTQTIHELLGSSKPTRPTLEQARIIYWETGMCWWPNTWCCAGQVGTLDSFHRADSFIERVTRMQKGKPK